MYSHGIERNDICGAFLQFGLDKSPPPPPYFKNHSKYYPLEFFTYISIHFYQGLVNHRRLFCHNKKTQSFIMFTRDLAIAFIK